MSTTEAPIRSVPRPESEITAVDATPQVRSDEEGDVFDEQATDHTVAIATSEPIVSIGFSGAT